MLLVGNGTLITRDAADSCIKDGCVAIDGAVVAETGPTGEIRAKHPGARFLDARGGIIMPGFINAHMHYYSAFSRGFAGKGPAGTNFVEVLERLWWRLDKALTLDDVYLSAKVCMIDCIKNGTTTVLDHHASPHAVRGSLFRIADAARETGVRSCLCYEVSDRDGEAVMREGIAENAEFIRSAARDKNDLLAGTFGLHASMTLSDATLEACAEAAPAQCGYHVHVAEGVQDEEDSLKKYGKRVVERFSDFGTLGGRSIAVHCVHVDHSEREILKETGTAVVFNPESNMGNAVGCAPALEMYGAGILTGLGTDGFVSDMPQSLKMANALLKHNARRPDAAFAEVTGMLFRNNAGIAERYFRLPLGRIAPGYSADVIVCDYLPPTELTGVNIDGHILYGTGGRCVTTTVARGRVLMEDRRLAEADEAETFAKAADASKKVWERF
ncbi:MAG: putative aminohydrolase SsnA [Synergistaceae bacterium]|jgi:putative selenium metabolism protein SsnA|nr:putative aminohydrolase SsnA [Synergistaceae bacterium]